MALVAQLDTTTTNRQHLVRQVRGFETALTETGSLKVKEAKGGGFETIKILETGSQRDEEKKRRREERGRRQLTGRR